MKEKNEMMPGNPRYQPKQLKEYFGYDNLFRGFAEVEIATLEVLGEIGSIPTKDIVLLDEVVKSDLRGITTSEVDKVEREVTRHDVRAWVQIAQGRVPERLRRWIHVPLTSFDPLDTGRILLFKRAHEEVVCPRVGEVMRHLIDKVREHAGTLQIGRTHGQHALPITVGFWLATILNRMLDRIQFANGCADRLVGKISGAVGAYNAQVALGITERCGEKTFEDRVLEKVGLRPARISTQILPPEPVTDLLYAYTTLSAVFGQLGLDCRQLMRTEINEVGEPFEKDHVGSSTMAHKRNPITYENMQGKFLGNTAEFLKVLSCLMSEHQRDLVGSSLMRDFPTIVINLMYQVNSFLRPGKTDKRPFIARMTIDKEACLRNLHMSGDAILAEPLYLALQMAGYEGDAHHLVSHRAMPLMVRNNTTLLEAVQDVLGKELGYEQARVLWRRIPQKTMEILHHPEVYIGLSKKKVFEITTCAEGYLGAPAVFADVSGA